MPSWVGYAVISLVAYFLGWLTGMSSAQAEERQKRLDRLEGVIEEEEEGS